MRNRLSIVIVIVFHLSLALFPGEMDINRKASVTINILSKQVRLVKEGRLSRIELLMPSGSRLEGENIHIDKEGFRVGLVYDNETWRCELSHVFLPGPFSIKIYHPEIKERSILFKVKLHNEVRFYPLPLNIRCNGKELQCTITEDLAQYAADVSHAEYGRRSGIEQEAVHALAQIIHARYLMMKGKKRHQDFDFCDLTHCHVYRGRMSKATNDSLSIDTHALLEELFFHSRCGGHTMDTRIFSTAIRKPKRAGVRDWFYRNGTNLCVTPESKWCRSLGSEELTNILLSRSRRSRSGDLLIEYDTEKVLIRIKHGNERLLLAPETFRLKVNRVKGWNFIKSNAYQIRSTEKKGEGIYQFCGKGLGHCVGYCQHGALALSRLGFNRYEILNHYFPEIKFKHAGDNFFCSPNLSYCIFDLETGQVRSEFPKNSFGRRILPPGSIFKLFVALYCAKHRTDIFNQYRYTCKGRNTSDTNLPDKCWTIRGHGPLNLEEAIPISCNLYFASLYSRISTDEFNKFFNNTCDALKIDARLPKIKNKKEWSELLAGLDFRVVFSAGDLMKIVRFLNPYISSFKESKETREIAPMNYRLRIFNSLKQTFVSGTASGHIKESGPAINYLLIKQFNKQSLKETPGDIWGKTSTVIYGTNKPISYGIFIGGSENTGIITILRRGIGHQAAKWAEILLSQQEK